VPQLKIDCSLPRLSGIDALGRRASTKTVPPRDRTKGAIPFRVYQIFDTHGSAAGILRDEGRVRKQLIGSPIHDGQIEGAAWRSLAGVDLGSMVPRSQASRTGDEASYLRQRIRRAKGALVVRA
jgi:hypothetical protein